MRFVQIATFNGFPVACTWLAHSDYQASVLQALTTTIAMKTSVAAVVLLLSLCALRATSQVPPYRQSVTVLRDTCPSAADLAGRALEPATASVLSNIAAGIANGTGQFRGIVSLRYYTSQELYSVEVQIVQTIQCMVEACRVPPCFQNTLRSDGVVTAACILLCTCRYRLCGCCPDFRASSRREMFGEDLRDGIHV